MKEQEDNDGIRASIIIRKA